MFLVDIEVREHQLDDLVWFREEGVQQADAARVGARVIWTAECTTLFAVRRCEAYTRTT